MKSNFKRALVVSVAILSSFSAISAERAIGRSANQIRVSGAGASFPVPLYSKWVTEFQAKHPSILIDYQGTGSGAGIKAITDKTVDFGGSDAPLSKKQLEAIGADKVVQIPATIGAVVPVYNLSGVSSNLNFTGEVLADIFGGKITRWNDAKLAGLNPDITLPDAAITPAWRTDGSGTTFVFTNYLASHSDFFRENVGMGSSVKWPGGQGGKGNAGVAAVVQQTAGSIGYVELNYATQNQLTFGSVKNDAGKFIKASPESIAHAASAAAEKLTGQVMATNLWNQPGESTYPIASFSYIIAHKDLSNMPSIQHAQALIDFLDWAIHDGQTIATSMDYGPLAPDVQAKVAANLKLFVYKGQAITPTAR